jgi:acetyltransferase-like isoleucine patch superfamily enzyme
MENFNRIAPDVRLGDDVRLAAYINAYGCSIGDRTKVGTFVEVQKNASIGADCKISSHTFVCEGVNIEDGVFIGHSVTFINDRFPSAVNTDGSLQTEADWSVESTRVCKRASVGSGSTILCGITIGEGAMIGAGSVVTKDVPAGELWAGNPARFMRKVNAGETQGA